MNRPSTKTKSLLMLLLSVALTGIFSSCSNSDYDFNEIDLTLGLGSDELIIPTSNTKEMELDDFLELDNEDCVKILDNGDYVFLQYGDEVAPAEPEIRPTSLTLVHPLPLPFIFDKYLNPSNTDIDINESQVVAQFEYDAENVDILSISSAIIDATLKLNTTFTTELAKSIEKFDKLEYELPDYMIIDNADGYPNIAYDKNVITLKDVPTNSDIAINVHVSKLIFQENNKMIGVEGKLQLNGDITLNAQTKVTITPEKKNYLTNCILTTTLSSDDIPIIEATGTFDPQIDLTNLGDVEVGDTPDFLKDEEVVIDLTNPQIFMTIENEMDATGNINGILTSIKGNKTLARIEIPEIKIHPFDPYDEEYKKEHPNSTSRITKICICRDASKVDPDSTDYDIYEHPELSELIKTIPDIIKFSAVTTVDNTYESTFVFGREYAIKPAYDIAAPISFGENANIVYTDSIDDMQYDIEDFEFDSNTYLEVTANVYNKMPVFLNTRVTPWDAEGNDLSKVVNITVENNIPAASEGQTARGTLKIIAKGDIKHLDKLKFTIGGKAKDNEGKESVTGITLNKYKHSLRLDDIKMKLVGKIIYDAN